MGQRNEDTTMGYLRVEARRWDRGRLHVSARPIPGVGDWVVSLDDATLERLLRAK